MNVKRSTREKTFVILGGGIFAVLEPVAGDDSFPFGVGTYFSFPRPVIVLKKPESFLVDSVAAEEIPGTVEKCDAFAACPAGGTAARV